MTAGNIADLALAIQAAKGTAATAAQYRTFLLGGGISPDRVVNDLEETSGTRLRSQSYPSMVSVAGVPEIAVRPEIIGAILFGALGDVTSTPTSVALTSSSQANPTLITTGAPHLLATGDVVTIAGHTGSTPAIDGQHVVTVVSGTTFTIPVNVTVAGTGGTVTTSVSHEFVPANQLAWFTAWRMLGDTVFERFVDCKMVQAVITSEAGQPLKAGVTVEGIRPQSQTTHTQSAILVSDSDPFMHYDGAGAFLVEGVAVSEIDRIVLTINNNGSKLQGDSLYPFTVSEGMLNITLEIGHVITDAELYNRFHYGAATPANNADATTEILELVGGIDFTWEQPSGESLQVVAERVQLKTLGGFDPNTGGDPLKTTQTYQVYQPSDGGPGLVATLVNDEAEYAAA